ncbi:MAG: response regulator transcription factor [Acidobacteria bacterium]|nr:response regulator transcription factor [Acidobacteriota bacterium]
MFRQPARPPGSQCDTGRVSGRRVLVVEDDPRLRDILQRGLSREGFDVLLAASGEDAMRKGADGDVAAVILDIGLPDADGRDVCQALRARGLTAPVIFLTARDALVDRLAGFDAGGDDYMMKPFEFEELIARLQAAMRRAGEHGALEGAGLVLDPAAHAVQQGDVRVALTPTEFRVLGALLARPGEAVRRQDIVRSGWPAGAIVSDNSVDAYIARVRRKVRDLPDPPQITTVVGVGYRLG